MKQTNNHEHSWIQDAPIKVCYHCGYKPQPTMKQTNNWEEFDRRLDKFAETLYIGTSSDGDGGEYDQYLSGIYGMDELKKFLHQELTNLLKTVAEANGDKKETSVLKLAELALKPEWRNKYSLIQIRSIVKGWNAHHSYLISNISEKYPEFINYIKNGK